MEEMYFIGMDCGTTNIKAVVLSLTGDIAAEASRALTVISSGAEEREQSAEAVWGLAAEIFREMTDHIGPEKARKIRGICVSSHTVSLLPVNSEGRPLRNAIIYQDSRSVSDLEEILLKIDRRRFSEITGGQPAVAFLPGKLLWFKRNEPELFQKTAALLQVSSYINFRLTGKLSTDLDQAVRTQCLDVEKLIWSDEISQASGMDFEQLFPEIFQPETCIGTVTVEASFLTGLPEGIPVAAGCSDAMAAMLAAGLKKPGDAGESSGTSSLFFIGSRIKSPPNSVVATKPSPVAEIPWIFDAPVQSTGAALQWFIDLFAQEEKEYCRKNGRNIFDHLNQLALDSVPGSNGLFFFPYLLGERAPLWNDYARGMFIGLTMSTKRSDLIRSVFEGTAFALRHVLETVRALGGEADNLSICGGGSKSRTWNRIKASVLNMPVKVLDETSGNVPVGDALIAAGMSGAAGDLSDLSERTIRVKEVIEPDPEWVRIYDERYPFFVSLYQSLDSELKRMNQIMWKR